MFTRLKFKLYTFLHWHYVKKYYLTDRIARQYMYKSSYYYNKADALYRRDNCGNVKQGNFNR